MPVLGGAGAMHSLGALFSCGELLKVKAKEIGQPLYALRSSLFSSYLRAELRTPRFATC